MNDAAQEQHRVSDSLIASTKAYTYPIYIMNDNKRPELVATSVAISISGKIFLCTAAHALLSIHQEKRNAFIGTADLYESGEYIELTEQAIYSTADNKVEFDICLIGAESLRAKIRFLDAARLAGGDAFGEKSIQTIQGYPCSRNKPTKTIDPTTHTVTSNLYTVGVRLDHSINFRSFNKHKSAHVAFKYDKGFDEAGMVDLLHPKGMSGCGIWNIPTPANPGTPSLVGIFIEYHKSGDVCFATRARFIKDLARKLN